MNAATTAEINPATILLIIYRLHLCYARSAYKNIPVGQTNPINRFLLSS